jgi:hypothetical protein
VPNASAGKRDTIGTIVGLLVFLFGIALLLGTFELAYQMFSVPPKEALELKQGDTLQVAPVASIVTGMIFKILLLVVMGILGSLIANRGIHLYTESRGLKSTKSDPIDA